MKRRQCVVINGKFYSQTVTGVQRYAREMLLELDKIAQGLPKLIVLTDRNARDVPNFKNILVVKSKRFVGNLWEQVSLPLFAARKKAVCLSLCNMAPILKPDMVVIHDVSYKVNRHLFSFKFALWYNLVFSLIIKRIKLIITVSEFSRSEISRCYNIDPEKITVTYNGWQHLSRIYGDKKALEKYSLTPRRYFFSMSSMAPNKNFQWIANAARFNPDSEFVVSGAVNDKVFGNIFNFEIPQNLKFVGYVSDEEAKELTANCRAFLFPSFYEGFGIPPLEAISCGAKAVVSDASCMREIFGEHVYYISPYKPDVDLSQLLSKPCPPADELLEKYSWEKSARILYNSIKSLCDSDG